MSCVVMYVLNVYTSTIISCECYVNGVIFHTSRISINRLIVFISNRLCTYFIMEKIKL